MCGSILPFPLPESPAVCVTCPLGFLVASEVLANAGDILCMICPTCNVPHCLRCSCDDPWKCIKCAMGYYHNPEGYCTPCPLYCPLCTNSAGCLLCKNYDNLPVIGLCVYNVYNEGTANSCAVSIRSDPTLCIACEVYSTGRYTIPMKSGYVKKIENNCQVVGCFSCVLNSETACKVCQGGYVLILLPRGVTDVRQDVKVSFSISLLRMFDRFYAYQ